MTADPLARLDDHLAMLEAFSLTDDAPLDEPPAFARHTLVAHDLERAQALLARVQRAEDRLHGMQMRVRGELASLRRPRRDGTYRAPRSLDTSA